MLNIIKKYKKGIALIMGTIVIVGGIMFAKNMFNRTVEREHLFIGVKREDSDSVSMGNRSITDKRVIQELHTLLGKAEEIAEIDEQSLTGTEVHFSINFGTYEEREITDNGIVYFQDNGSAIYEDSIERKYYQIPTDQVEPLKKLLKA